MGDRYEEGPARCAIVLAGGSGQRLNGWVHRFRGDNLPKQYVALSDEGSLLERTFERVERLIDPERVFTITTQTHLTFPEAKAQLDARFPGTVIVQPDNKETAPGVLLPLLHIEARFGDSAVALFPSDHHIEGEGLFMGYVDLALRIVDRYPSRVVLLGATPDAPESEYGYLVPGPSARHTKLPGLRRVAAFIEKPNRDRAGELIAHGALWNTMVMTFRVRHLLAQAERILPDVSRAFARIRGAIGTPREDAVVDAVYSELPAINFSRTLLQALPAQRSSSLLVLPMRGVSWSDCGSEQRITTLLERTGHPTPAAPRVAQPAFTMVARSA